MPLRLRSSILELERYRQGGIGGPDSFKLSSNENPFPPLPSVLAEFEHIELNRYPPAEALPLRERLAARYGVSAAHVHVGAGSIAILDQLLAVTCGAGDEVVFSWRSFEAYPGLATVRGARAVMVANTPDHRHDLNAMAAAITDRTGLVIVCSPNNPTGATVSSAEFVSFMDAVPSDLVVALDEAYVEFVTDADAVDGATLLSRYPNLVILRTFSKAWGLAAVRAGYALGTVDLLDALRVATLPLSVTEFAQRLAIASLDVEDELFRRVEQLVQRRERLWGGLVEQGWQVPPSQANFVWLPVGDRALAVAEAFGAGGVVTRPFAGDGVRVSIGEAESVDRLLVIAQSLVDPVRTRVG